MLRFCAITPRNTSSMWTIFICKGRNHIYLHSHLFFCKSALTPASELRLLCKNTVLTQSQTVYFCIQKFDFINGVDNVNWPPCRDSKRSKRYFLFLAFRISARWQIYIINSVDKTKFLYTTSPPTQHHSFFRNYPLHSVYFCFREQVTKTCAENILEGLPGRRGFPCSRNYFQTCSPIYFVSVPFPSSNYSSSFP